jgi:Ca-activated chloride channel family protein
MPGGKVKQKSNSNRADRSGVISGRRLHSCFPALLAVSLLLNPLAGVAQSGRVQSEKPPRPVAPARTPPLRLPESRPATPASAEQSPRPATPVRTPEVEKTGDDDTIRIASDLVTVVASVSTNAANDPPRLEVGDFEILEDGVRQELVNFARDSQQPLQLVVLMDTSLSVAQKLDFEKKAMLRFLERVLRPQDRAALFAVSTEVSVLQDFTSQLPQLTQAARQLKAQGATSLYDAIYLAADYLRPTTGRRVIVVVSDGSDTTSQKGLLAALERAQQADAMIYAVYTGNFGLSQNLRDLAGERALETLTAETGGELLRPQATPGSQSNDVDDLSLRQLDRSFANLAEQLRTQYILGFYSTNERRDGSYRKLVVKIGRPGLTPRARAGYYAPKSQ